MVKYDHVQQLRQKALMGDLDAQCDLAETYDEGRPRNLKKAFYWYNIAAERGNHHALNNLAYLYEHGRGISKNRKKAIYYYKKASNKGNVIATANLGVLMYEDRKYRRAKMYLEQALASGDEECKVYLHYIKNKDQKKKHGV